MAQVDLSSLRQGPLDIGVGDGVVYKVRPTAEDLLRMGTFVAAVEAAMRVEDDDDRSRLDIIRDLLAPEDHELLDSNEAMLRVQLGSDVYEQMLADGVTPPDVMEFGRYSMNYHVKGARYAAAMLELAAAVDEPEPEAEFPKPSRSGRPTASGSRTKTASTGGTGSSRSTSGKSSTRSRTKK